MPISSQTKSTSAIFVGFAGSDAPITAEDRNALENILIRDDKLPPSDMLLPVPTGLVLCFDFPTRTLEFTRRLGARLRLPDWPLPALRMGVHASTVIIDAGASDTSISTGGMDGAMRVARLAGVNQALATPAFHDLVTDMTKSGASHFGAALDLPGRDGKSVKAFEILPFPARAVTP